MHSHRKKTKYPLTLLGLFVGIAGLFPSLLLAQSSNERAQEWFEKGHLASKMKEKAHDYLMATRADTSFAEAYYFLAKTYQAQKRHFQARNAYLKAFRLAVKQKNFHLAYKSTKELAEMSLQTSHSQDYEKALRAAIQFAPSDSHRQELKVQLSRFLFKSNRKAEAIAILKELQQNAEQSSSNTFLSHAQIIDLLEQLEQHIKAGRLAAAKTILDSINTARPSARYAARIAKLDSLLQAKSLENENKKLYSLAIELATQGKVEEAIFLLEKILSNTPNYRDAALLLKQYKKIRSQQKKRRKADAQHVQPTADGQSMVALKWKDKSSPKPTESETNEAKVQKSSQKALSLTNKDTLSKSLIVKNEKKVQDPLPKKEKKLPHSEFQLLAEAGVPTKTKKNTKLKGISKEINMTNPQLRSPVHDLSLKSKNETAIPLSKRPSHLTDPSGAALAYQSGSKPSPKLLLISVTGIGFLIITLMTIHFMYPFKIAQALVFANKIDWAIKYLEGFLRKRPGRLELFGILANLYVEVGRDDYQAIQVFQTVLDHSIKVRHAEEMIRQVKLYYERKGAMDSQFQEILIRHEQ